MFQMRRYGAYGACLPQPETGCGKRRATAEVSPAEVQERRDLLLSNTIGQCPVTELEVLGAKFTALVDTCSQVSMITESFYKRHLQPRGRELYNQDLHLHLTTANGLEVRYSGYLLTDVTIADHVVKDRTFSSILPAWNERPRGDG